MWKPRINSKGSILILVILSAFGAGLCEEVTTVSSECGDDCSKTNGTGFAPPPADAMSRLMPTSQVVLSNDTKDPSASNIDIVTTPDTGSQGLSAFSSPQFSQQSSQGFNPSPFLGVISETHINSYPQGVAIGEVFPDSIGDRHLGGHKYLYSIAGQRAPHTGHSYHDQQGTRQRPTPLTTVDTLDGFQSTQGVPEKISFAPTQETFAPTVETSYPSLTYAPHKESVSLASSTKSLGYPVFEIPDRLKEFKEVSNSITDYRPPSPVAFPSYDKPIREDLFDDRPDPFPSHGGPGPGPGAPDAFGGPGPGAPDAYGGGYDVPPPGLPPPPAFTSPPALFKKPPVGFYKGGKWGGFFKVLASLIPLGVLLAAFSPSLLVVNATEEPAPLVEAPPQSQQLNSQSQTQAQLQPQLQPPSSLQYVISNQSGSPPAQYVITNQSGPTFSEWTKIPTWSPAPTAKTSYRSLESLVAPPEIPSGLRMTQCQKKKVCEALLGVDDSFKTYVESLVFRVGGGLKEAADLASARKCIDIPCTT